MDLPTVFTVLTAIVFPRDELSMPAEHGLELFVNAIR